MVKYDIQAIKDACDMTSLLEWLGFRTVQKSNRTWIECPNPNHHDTHLTNAYIKNTPRGEIFVCEACHCHNKDVLSQFGATAPDVIGLMQMVTGCSFTEALEKLSAFCGGTALFASDDPEYEKHRKAQIELKKSLPSKEVQELLHLESDKVYGEVAFYSIYSDLPPLKRGQIVELVDNGDEPIYVIKQLLDPNPLISLAKEEPEAMKDMFVKKAEEGIIFFDAAKKIATSPKARSYSDKLTEVCNIVGRRQYAQVCDSAIETLEDFLIENEKGKSKKTKIFGKIKVGAF